MNVSQDSYRGIISLLVMSVLKKQCLYGYKIIETIQIHSEYKFKLNEGTLYPILHSLEKDGLLESYWEEYSNRKRKYYRLTEKGLHQFEMKYNAWKIYSRTVDKILSLDL